MTDNDVKTVDHESATHGPRNETWMRGLYMLLLLFAFGICQSLLVLLALVQFLWLLFAKKPNEHLGRFGASLSKWFADTVRFLSCDSEQKPFPWSNWPSGN